MNKEVKQLIRELRRLDVEVEPTRKGHFRVRDLEGRTLTCFPSSPSCPRSLKNTRADLRRLGVPL